MITKKDITTVINEFSKELRNIPFRNDIELRRKADSIIVYTDYTTVSSYSLGNRTREQTEDYNRIAMICNKYSFHG